LRFNAAGRVQEFQRTGTGTLAEARKALTALRQQAEAHQERSLSVRTDVSTFGAALAYYRTHHDPGRSASYFDRLEADLGAVRLADLRERFDTYLLTLRRSVGPRGRPMANGTINAFLAWSNAALNECVRHGQIERNPIAGLRKLRETPRDVTLCEADRLRLLSIVERHAPHLLPVVTFASLVPTRRGELVNLPREAVDNVNNVIRLRSGTTKNGDGRYLPIPEELRDYFASIPPTSATAFYRPGRDGECRPIGDFKRAWHRCLRLAGLEALHFHDLRAAAATRLMLAGNDTRAVMAVAGWKSDMLRVYYRRDSLATAQGLRFGPSVGATMGAGYGGAPLRKAENC
jgi:integrase